MTTKENLLKKMRTGGGRLQPTIFRSVDGRLNHSATVTDDGPNLSIMNFVEWWHLILTEKVTNPDCELISLC